jgi:putative ATPase
VSRRSGEPPGSLFDAEPTARLAAAPLAERMRPRRADEIVGHPHLAAIFDAARTGRLTPVVLEGPPGCGKTTAARLLAAAAGLHFVPFSAVTSGIKEVREVMEEARLRFRREARSTVLFVDEIHRFNRSQQDAFLPFVEAGEIILVGATTENAAFALTSALLSRCRVVRLEALPDDAIEALLRRALADPERGLAALGVVVEDDAVALVVEWASGDARRGLGLLELLVDDAVRLRVPATAARLAELARRPPPRHDRSGDFHFDLLSAFHKSLRESDADAGLYWLARMLEAGEDPRVAARRMVCVANEDVGLADPRAVEVALAAWSAFERLGSPEGDYALAQAVVYLALAPKSNAAHSAFGRAREAARQTGDDPVPLVVRNAPTALARERGHGDGWRSAHESTGGVGGFECRPPSVAGSVWYEPRRIGIEARLVDRLAEVEAARQSARRPTRGPTRSP